MNEEEKLVLRVAMGPLYNVFNGNCTGHYALGESDGGVGVAGEAVVIVAVAVIFVVIVVGVIEAVVVVVAIVVGVIVAVTVVVVVVKFYY